MERVVSAPFSPIAAAFTLLAAPAFGQVVINEYVSSNVESLIDENGKSPDWIELWNSGSTTVDLTGWGLSDDVGDVFQWQFPQCYLKPGEYLLVHASGLDQRVLHNEFHSLITQGDEWSYAPGIHEPPSNWIDVNFDDSAWPTGPSGFGFADQDDATWVNENSVYLRKAFHLPANFADGASMVYLHVDIDDGFVAYLNGAEISRSNMGRPGDRPPFDQLADYSLEAHLYRGWSLNAIPIGDFRKLFHAGKNVLAIQAHNASASGGDLTAVPFLSAARNRAKPASNIHPLLLFPTPQLHTNFKLSATGERLFLSDASGSLVDQAETGAMYVDISKGRHPQGLPGQWYFEYATPGSANTSSAWQEFSTQVSMNPPAGSLASGEIITLRHPIPGAEIRYTLDGSDPTASSPLYTSALIRSGVYQVVRARAFENNKWPSWPTTSSYFGNVSSEVVTFSLVTDPDNLWDPNIGIYENFSEDWERPVHVEMFEPDGSMRIALDAGIRIHGGLSRIWAQKSFRILARGGYRTADITERVFKTEGLDTFKHLLLRNAGTDNNRAHLRDGLASRLIRGVDLEAAAFRPAIVILNGEYWGVQNLRERIDKYYLEGHLGVDPDQLDLLENAGRGGPYTKMVVDAVEGDLLHWDNMISFVLRNDLSIPANYSHLQTLIDTDNFANYQIIEIFCANKDWPQHNSKMWRPHTADGRWRWLLYDVDNSMGAGADAFDNTLRYAIGAETNPGVINFSFLFREMLKNTEFRNAFINRYADFLNTRFTTNRAFAVLADIEAEMLPEMKRHMGRWNQRFYKWEDQLDTIRTFFQLRPGRARQHIRSEFNLPIAYKLNLDVYPTGGGRMKLTAIEVTDAFEGTYFPTVPVQIEAIPAQGYMFDSWSDPLLPSSPSISIDQTTDYALTANFLKVGPSVVINEINYKSSDHFDPGDWLELHNNSDQAIDLSDWELSDNNNSYSIPAGTVVPARGYLVLCQDLSSFQSLFPAVSGALGDIGFGFSGSGELLQLHDAAGSLQDSVPYLNQPPWPIAASGLGPSLELLRPALENNDGRQWRASIPPNGTPGSLNSAPY